MTVMLLLTITCAGALLAFVVSRLTRHQALIYRAIAGSAGMLYFSYLAIDLQRAGESPKIAMFWALVALMLSVNGAVNLGKSERQSTH